MSTQIEFKKGDVLFRQGDASDQVLRVVAGEIEILREVGTASAFRPCPQWRVAWRDERHGEPLR